MRWVTITACIGGILFWGTLGRLAYVTERTFRRLHGMGNDGDDVATVLKTKTI